MIKSPCLPPRNALQTACGPCTQGLLPSWKEKRLEPGILVGNKHINKLSIPKLITEGTQALKETSSTELLEKLPGCTPIHASALPEAPLGQCIWTALGERRQQEETQPKNPNKKIQQNSPEVQRGVNSEKTTQVQDMTSYTFNYDLAKNIKWEAHGKVPLRWHYRSTQTTC